MTNSTSAATRAPRRPRGASKPAAAPPAKRAASQKPPKTKQQPAPEPAAAYHVARAIIDETPKHYLIDWEGIDPATTRPFPPTWEPKRNANAELKKTWAEKKEKEQDGVGQNAADTQRAEDKDGRVKVPVEPGHDAAIANAAGGSGHGGAQGDDAAGAPKAPARTREDEADVAADTAAADTAENDVEPSFATARDEPEQAPRSPSPAREATQKRKRSPSPAADQPPAKQPRVDEATNPAANLAANPAARGEDDVYAVRAITGEKRRKFRVAWEKNPVTGEEYEDTWEPKGNVSRDLVRQWKWLGRDSEKALEALRRREEGLSEEEEEDPDVFPAKAIVGERTKSYRVQWEKNPTTGEEYEDTWEFKRDVSSDLVKAWKQQKRQEKLAKREAAKARSALRQQQKKPSVPVSAEPSTPRKEDDGEEGEDDESCPPSSTMNPAATTAQGASDTTTGKRGKSENNGKNGAHTNVEPANGSTPNKKQIDSTAPAVDNASPFGYKHRVLPKAVVVYGSQDRRSFMDSW